MYLLRHGHQQILLVGARILALGVVGTAPSAPLLGPSCDVACATPRSSLVARLPEHPDYAPFTKVLGAGSCHDQSKNEVEGCEEPS